MSIFTTFADKIEAGVNKIGLELVGEWRKFYTMYSVWFFALVGAAPDLYNLAVSSNLLTGASTPPLLAHIINIIAFVGAATRLIKQKRLSTVQDALDDVQSQKDLARAETQLAKAETGATPPAPVSPESEAAAPAAVGAQQQPPAQ